MLTQAKEFGRKDRKIGRKVTNIETLRKRNRKTGYWIGLMSKDVGYNRMIMGNAHEHSLIGE